MVSSISRISEKISTMVKPSTDFTENKKILKSIPGLNLTKWMMNKVAAGMVRMAKKLSN